MIVTSFQDLNFRGKQISTAFSYFLINKALLYHFLATLLSYNKKMTEKSVFREPLSPECCHNHSQSPVFLWSRCFEPYRK